MDYLYHGTDIDSAKDICCCHGIDVTRGSKHSDFGQGFYAMDSYDRAVKWAKRKASIRGKKAAVITLTVDLQGAKKSIEAFEDDLRWGRFVVNNRNGMSYINKIPFKEINLDARYAITYGRIADVEILSIARKLASNNEMLYSLVDIWNPDYPMQYAFHTKEATQYIKCMTYKQV